MQLFSLILIAKIIVIIISLTLTKLNNFNRHNRFVLIVNFHNRFDKALRKIFQFCRALILYTSWCCLPSFRLSFLYLMNEVLYSNCFIVFWQLFWPSCLFFSKKVVTEICSQFHQHFKSSFFANILLQKSTKPNCN